MAELRAAVAEERDGIATEPREVLGSAAEELTHPLRQRPYLP
jgi:hypothetical protein